GEHHAVGDDLDLAGGEANKDCCALVDWRRAVDVLRAHPGAHELVADMDAMTDAAGEGDGLAALAVLEPMRSEVSEELVPIHPLGELGLEVVAGLRSDASQIRIGWSGDPRPPQVTVPG